MTLGPHEKVGQNLTKESNAERRAAKLRREMEKQHNWRVSTWARAQQYINERQKELNELGFETFELFQPDFNNESLLEGYKNLTAPK